MRSLLELEMKFLLSLFTASRNDFTHIKILNKEG